MQSPQNNEEWEWSDEQRVAVKGEMEYRLSLALKRLVKLSQGLVEEISIAEYLIKREAELRQNEEELLF